MSGQPKPGEEAEPAPLPERGQMKRLTPEQVAAHLANHKYDADPSLENLTVLSNAMHALRVAWYGPDPEPGPPLTREQVIALLATPPPTREQVRAILAEPPPELGPSECEVSADETSGSNTRNEEGADPDAH